MWEGSEIFGGRRKSARISALKEEKKNKAFSKSIDNVVSETGQNQTHVAARTATSTGKRGRKRKRLEDVVQLPQQDGENQKQEDYSIKNDQAANLPSIQQVPEKRILEFILDTLQRRDTHDIFAQPVDPKEVGTYYTIIKEPMDFGTMRAKLHEGMYTSLEQFEHDVFLISSNAMHFNSSATIYYQEALAIQELAHRLFHVLKSDPESFQLRFILKRRFPSRKPQSEAGGLQRKSAKSGGVRRRKQTDSNSHIDQGKSTRLRGGRNSNLFETERCLTYFRPSNDNESLLSTVYNAPKPLVHIDAGFRYTDSLLRFVKDLGPTAQLVAKRKLESMTETPNFQSLTTPATQTQNYPPYALSVPGVPGHPVGVHGGLMNQLQHNSPYNLRSDSNASYFHGVASARGYARVRSGISINEGAYKGKLNVFGTSRFRMESSDNDSKGKTVLQAAVGKNTYNKAFQEEMANIDINRNLNIPGLTTGIGLQGSNMEATADQNRNSKVRLESHIRVVRDLSSPGLSNNGVKFRTVDMLAKPNNQGNLQLQQPQLSRAGQPLSNQSRLLEIMSRRNTYLRPSSYNLASPAPLSSLSQASNSFSGIFGSQMNNIVAANSAQAMHNAIGSHERATTIQWNQMEPTSQSFLSLLQVDSQQPNLALQL